MTKIQSNSPERTLTKLFELTVSVHTSILIPPILIITITVSFLCGLLMTLNSFVLDECLLSIWERRNEQKQSCGLYYDARSTYQGFLCVIWLKKTPSMKITMQIHSTCNKIDKSVQVFDWICVFLSKSVMFVCLVWSLVLPCFPQFLLPCHQLHPPRLCFVSAALTHQSPPLSI